MYWENTRAGPLNVEAENDNSALKEHLCVQDHAHPFHEVQWKLRGPEATSRARSRSVLPPQLFLIPCSGRAPDSRLHYSALRKVLRRTLQLLEGLTVSLDGGTVVTQRQSVKTWTMMKESDRAFTQEFECLAGVWDTQYILRNLLSL